MLHLVSWRRATQTKQQIYHQARNNTQGTSQHEHVTLLHTADLFRLLSFLFATPFAKHSLFFCAYQSLFLDQEGDEALK
jgi:hypothetical protein